MEFPGPTGGAASGSPPVVCVHGLGGSHQNWIPVGPLLARRHRVLAPDLAGFGLTPPAGRSSHIRAHRRLLSRFVEEVAGEPVILIGNSMGGMVSMLEAAAEPERVRGLVLLDPALPTKGMRLDRVVAMNFAAFALPGVGEQVLHRRRQRLSIPSQVDQTLSLVFADSSRVTDEQRSRAEDLARERQAYEWATPAFLESARSLLTTLAQRRAHRQRVETLEAPALVIHGAQDRLVKVAAAHELLRLRPDWELVVLEGVGHVPQMEAPERVAALVEAWAERILPGPAATITRRTDGPQPHPSEA